MTDRVVELAVGTQVWFEGGVWVVRELGPRCRTTYASGIHGNAPRTKTGARAGLVKMFV